MRGTNRYCTGGVPIATSASICSVARMVPSSAAIALPARAVTSSALNTGPTSRRMLSATIPPAKLAARKRWKPRYICRPITMPEKRAVKNATGAEDTPMRTI